MGRGGQSSGGSSGGAAGHARSSSSSSSGRSAVQPLTAQTRRARPAHWHVPDLGQAQLPAGQHLEPGAGGEPDGLPAVLAEPGPAGLGVFGRRRRRRRCSGTRRSGPPGPAGVPRQICHRAGPAPGGRGRGQPRRQVRPSRSSASTSNTATAPPDRPTPPPSAPARRPARWHLVRSRARRCRSGGPGSPRRCVPGRPVLAGGGAPGRGSGCGGRSSP